MSIYRVNLANGFHKIAWAYLRCLNDEGTSNIRRKSQIRLQL